jgi:hypothetical protein
VEAPTDDSKVLPIDSDAAQRLAYYASNKSFGVLAPRGWYCFGTYGSDGVTLYVSSQPIDTANLFSTTWGSFAGPVIEVSQEDGDTWGRFSVAKTIARVFPAHTAFARKVIGEGVEAASDFPFGPYRNDKLIYKSTEIVEYQSPAHTEGLGTRGVEAKFLQRDADPISGVAILVGPDPNLLLLSARLPPEQHDLTPYIIQQVERDAANQPQLASPSTTTTSQPTGSVPSSTASKVSMGYPVPEKTFVNAYVLANTGRDDLDDDQLAQLAHDEYQMAKDIDTQTLLLGGSFLNTRGMRAMNYLYKLNRQLQQTR